MRVLFTTTPGWGHVHPMVPLAMAFREQGAEVAWAAAAEVCPLLVGEGFQAFPSGLGAEGMAIFYERFPEVNQLPPAERPDFMFPRLFGAVRAAPFLSDLLPLVRDWQPSVIVRDAAEFAGSIAAALTGVAAVTHSFGDLLPRERVAEAGRVVGPLWEAHGLEARPYGGSYDHLYLDIYPPSLRGADAAHVPALQALRPVPFATGGAEALPEAILVDGAPIVYVTFGTIFNRDPGLFATVIDALGALPIRVVVTLGPGVDRAVLGDLPAHVHAFRYIPQTRLLPRCAAVVSHGGSGTFLAALGHGIPQLCLPQAADQFLNAAACVRGRAGLALGPGAVTPEAVRGATERLLADPDLRAGAAGLRDEMAHMPSPEQVARTITDRFGGHGPGGS